MENKKPPLSFLLCKLFIIRLFLDQLVVWAPTCKYIHI